MMMSRCLNSNTVALATLLVLREHVPIVIFVMLLMCSFNSLALTIKRAKQRAPGRSLCSIRLVSVGRLERRLRIANAVKSGCILAIEAKNPELLRAKIITGRAKIPGPSLPHGVQAKADNPVDQLRIRNISLEGRLCEILGLSQNRIRVGLD